jgi:hypothetical protein
MAKEYIGYVEEIVKQRGFLLDELDMLFNELDIATKTRVHHIDIKEQYQEYDYPSLSGSDKHGKNYYRYTIYKLNKDKTGKRIGKKQIGIACYTKDSITRYGTTEETIAKIEKTIKLFKQIKQLSEVIANYKEIM